MLDRGDGGIELDVVSSHIVLHSFGNMSGRQEWEGMPAESNNP